MMFGRFVAASGLANLADGVAVLAWVWVASLLTRDAALIALVPVALRLPWAVFAVPAGVVADRVDRRRLILTMDVLRAAAFALAAAALWGAQPLPPAPGQGLAQPGLFALLCAAALLVGVAEVFRDNAAQTMLPALVPHDRLEAANARLWTVEMVGNALVGPAFGALLLGVFLPLPFGLNAAAYAGAALLMAGLPGAYRPVATGARRSWWAEAAEGWRFLRGQPLLLRLAGITGLWNLCDQMILFAMLLIAQERLGLSSAQYGLVLAAGAAGGIAAGLVGERAVRLIGPSRLARGALFVSPACYLALAFAPTALSFALIFAVLEFSGPLWNIVSVSTRQRLIPDALMGRVNSLYRLLAWGMMPLGTLLAGGLIAGAEGGLGRAAALHLPLLVAAGLALVLALLAWPVLRRGLPRRAA